MKVLLTGNLGYVGRVLASMLVEKKFEVIGCDIGLYPQEFINEKTEIGNLGKDIRNITKEDLKGYHAVLHLAGLSNDPVGEINPDLTNQINFLATIRLAKLAKDAGVERFVFSSSCSNYGASNDIVSEKSSLTPLTAYAKSKVDSEIELLKLQSNDFAPIILRNATVYGVSPSQRLDLVVNNLTTSAFTTGVVKILSDGTSWRPLLHVKDMASAFIQILDENVKDISGEIFNVGSNEENYTVKEIAKNVESIVPNSKIEFAKNANKDMRSYKVDFSKIKNQLNYETKFTIIDGIKELYKVLKDKDKFEESDFNDKAYYRVKYIKWLIENKTIDENLQRLKN